MAESREFDNAKDLRFDLRSGLRSGPETGGGQCEECESMLADSLDGNLGAAEQARFEGHIAECGPCSRLLAETQRGAAWLEELRMARPDPPADLLERILAVTSGAQRGWMQGHAAAWSRGEVVGFRRRLASAIQRGSFGQIVLQPRLAMTAAMAFFSIALTMNLTGVHPQDLRASDIQPASLRRAFYSANARVVQYYEGLRVVYELESRVHDFESANDKDVPSGSQSAPINAAPSSGKPPRAQPGPGGQKANPPGDGNRLDRSQTDRRRHALNPGIGWRESFTEGRRRVVAATRNSRGFGERIGSSVDTGLEGGMA